MKKCAWADQIIDMLKDINHSIARLFEKDNCHDVSIQQVKTTIQERQGETKVMWQFIWIVVGSAVLNTGLVVALVAFIIKKLG